MKNVLMVLIASLMGSVAMADASGPTQLQCTIGAGANWADFSHETKTSVAKNSSATIFSSANYVVKLTIQHGMEMGPYYLAIQDVKTGAVYTSSGNRGISFGARSADAEKTLAILCREI